MGDGGRERGCSGAGRGNEGGKELHGAAGVCARGRLSGAGVSLFLLATFLEDQDAAQQEQDGYYYELRKSFHDSFHIHVMPFTLIIYLIRFKANGAVVIPAVPKGGGLGAAGVLMAGLALKSHGDMITRGPGHNSGEIALRTGAAMAGTILQIQQSHSHHDSHGMELTQVGGSPGIVVACSPAVMRPFTVMSPQPASVSA